MKHQNIILIGFAGSGKTTVGEALAAELQWEFVDIDQAIEAQAGCPIPELFSTYGEPHFRKVETDVLSKVLEHSSQVVSTGAGAVLAVENRERMMNSGYIVALTATAETIIQRVKGDSNRPLFQGNLEEKVLALLEQRKYAYDFADITIPTSELTSNEIIEIILHNRK